MKKFDLKSIFENVAKIFVIKGLGGKMFIIFAILLVVFISSFLKTRQLIQEKKNDAITIEIASTLSHMTYGYVKDFFLFVKTGEMDSVQATLHKFDETILKLKKGGEIEVNGHKAKLTPESNKDVLAQFKKVESKWTDIKSFAVSVIDDPSSQNFTVLSNKSKDALLEVTNLIQLYQRISNKKFSYLEMAQVISLSTAIIFFIIALAYLRFRVSNPMQISFDKMRLISDELLKQSVDVGKISESLSSASTEQASALEETTATMRSIQSMVESNSASAKATFEKSNLSKILSSNGRNLVSEMVKSIVTIDTSIENIKQQVEASDVEILGIIDIIDEIDNKTKVINDIVFQTKLLSFNASVEAARAGENGKGFAVVAEEIGNLAQMSGSAAEEIMGVLDSSEKQIKGIVSGNSEKLNTIVNNATKEVAKGKEKAHECDKTLEDISTQTDEINSLIETLAQSANEQFEGVKNTYVALTQLDELSNSNRELSEESSQYSIKLNSQAKILDIDLVMLRKLLLG